MSNQKPELPKISILRYVVLVIVLLVLFSQFAITPVTADEASLRDVRLIDRVDEDGDGYYTNFRVEI